MSADEAAVAATALDYFEGWYDGDEARMQRALHPELVKRCIGEDGGRKLGRTLTKDMLRELVREGSGREDKTDDPIDVEVCDVHSMIASAVVRSRQYREYLHLAKTPDGWRIVNAFWQFTEPQS